MEQDEASRNPTRRTVVKSGAAFVAPIILGSGSAAMADEASRPAPAESDHPAQLRNPRDAYPKPPFPKQQQEAPGLAMKMDPRPDHGEKSYRGSGKLAGRKALITGGDSGIGRATAIAFAREGADVAFGYLPFEEPDAQEVVSLIKSAGRKAVPLPGDIRDESFCQKLVNDAVSALGGLDILVNNAGKQHAVQDIADLTTEQFDATFKTNVYAMFWITKAGAPAPSRRLCHRQHRFDPGL